MVHIEEDDLFWVGVEVCVYGLKAVGERVAVHAVDQVEFLGAWFDGGAQVKVADA